MGLLASVREVSAHVRSVLVFVFRLDDMLDLEVWLLAKLHVLGLRLPLQVFHLSSFPGVNGRKMVLYNVVLPIIYGSVSNSFLRCIVSILDVKSSAPREISDCKLDVLRGELLIKERFVDGILHVEGPLWVSAWWWELE